MVDTRLVLRVNYPKFTKRMVFTMGIWGPK